MLIHKVETWKVSRILTNTKTFHVVSFDEDFDCSYYDSCSRHIISYIVLKIPQNLFFTGWSFAIIHMLISLCICIYIYMYVCIYK